MRRLLIALAAALTACVLASPAFAANPIRISDPTGDAANVPDIAGVTIEASSTAFQFTVELATMQNLLPDGVVLAFIDSDRNPQTGGLDAGVDFVAVLQLNGPGLVRWTGTTFEPTADDISPTLSLEGRLTFTIAKTAMNNTQKIDVVVIATTDSSENSDGAPDQSPFTYLPPINQLLIPATVSSVRAGGVLSARAVRAQMTPTAGQTVMVQPTLRCTLTYRGRTIKAMAGGCRWRIPRSWRGRRLTLRILATVGTESQTQTVTVRVR